MTRAHVGLLLLLVGCAGAPPAPPPAPATSVAALRDFDGDGLVDPRDLCPRVAGVAPLGCPPDADRDGVVDALDACPKDHGRGLDGCDDVDQDGVPEPPDACAQQAETRNGYLDADGCPDVLPDDLTRIQGILVGVQCNLEKRTFRPSSRSALDRVAAVLREYPEVRVEISAHWDSTHEIKYSVDPSGRCAGAIREYLVERGVDRSRIESRGAGPDEPIDTNKTAAGRARNRRVELVILVQ